MGQGNYIYFKQVCGSGLGFFLKPRSGFFSAEWDPDQNLVCTSPRSKYYKNYLNVILKKYIIIKLKKIKSSFLGRIQVRFFLIGRSGSYFSGLSEPYPFLSWRLDPNTVNLHPDPPPWFQVHCFPFKWNNILTEYGRDAGG